MGLHVRGRVLPEGEERDLYVDDQGLLTPEPVPGATSVVDGGWLVPGLVDMHTHPGTHGTEPDLDPGLLRRHLTEHRDAGVTVLRCPGLAGAAPAAVRADPTLPRMITAGRWLVAPDGFLPGKGREVPVDELPSAAVEQAREADGWCKVITDWSYYDDAGTRRYLPSFPADVLTETIRGVQAAGGRVAVHSQHPDTGAVAAAAGVDSLEHGMHLDHEMLDTMATHGTALVPTLTAFATHDRPDPDAVDRFMIAGFERHPALVAAAHDAGVPVLAGTDGLPHGNVATEIEWLARCGLSTHDALGAGSWAARSFLGVPGLEPGAPADLVAYDRDPRADLTELRRPRRIILRGRVAR